MMLQDEILTLLRSGGGAYLSGEAMSRKLGVSRAAVWKAVDALRREGYAISSGSNRGYRLESAPDTLRAGELSQAWAGRLVGSNLACLETVDSTNNEIKRRAANGAPEGLAVLTDEQTGGRGRRGNAFQSLKGKGLYCSILLRPRLVLDLDKLSTLTAWVAVAASRAVEACCGLRPGIKWTNDLVLGGRKLCGILTELELEAETGEPSAVIAGIGINVGQTDGDFGPALSRVATSLEQELGSPVRRADLAVCLLRALDDMYAAFPAAKADYLAEYRARCVTTGHEVYLVRGEERLPAFAESVDEDFALLCRMPDGSRRRVTAGEVSVRGLMGYV